MSGLLRWLLAAATAAAVSPAFAAAAPRPMRVCAAQTRNRTIDWRLTAAQALARVDESLAELEKIVHRAGAAGCDALALPEDTLGLLRWEAGHKTAMDQVLPAAVARMVERLGRAAAAHHMYLVCSSDITEPDRTYVNAAFFLGRDGRTIGRYVKVQPTVQESDRKRGAAFPVFETPDLGTVGMQICYDMVMPESSRSLALAGAGLIFVSTMGGAAMGDEDMNRAAFRTRAVDNFVYLVVAKRAGGSMIISPQGKVLAEGKGPDGIAMAEIDPFGGRAGGDAHSVHADMRARLFRERNPAAYGLLTDPHPPVLDKLPVDITVADAVRIMEKTLTVGDERYAAAEALAKAGDPGAAAAFEKLCAEFPGTWIDRAARRRLAELRATPR